MVQEGGIVMTNVNIDKYFNEIGKLTAYLMSKNYNVRMNIVHDGFQVEVLDDQNERIWDAICHSGSYGHEEGLIEIMGESVVRNEFDDVEGWLTAADVIERLEEVT